MISLFDYISRIGKSRGFGIQSPWAYNFVRDVIFEKRPYYIYSEIDKQFSGRKERKKQKLYFRVRNFVNNKNFSVQDISDINISDIKNISEQYNGEGVIIIENIYSSSANSDKWLQIKNSEHIGITFDLYFCSICFMPNNMYKQHYKLNF